MLPPRSAMPRALPLYTLLSCFLAAPSSAETWFVDASAAGPGDGSPGNPYASIQFAIDQGSTLPGDVLSIAPGTYQESLLLAGKPLELHGAGPELCIVDAGGLAPALQVLGSGTAGSLIQGLALVNGNGAAFGGGGGLRAVDSQLCLRDCELRDSEFLGIAGGFYAKDSDLSLEYVTVRDNGTFFISTLFDAAGGRVEGGSLSANACLFQRNHAFFSFGALYAKDADLRLRQVVFEDNSAGFGDAGGLGLLNCTASLTECSFVGCLALDAGRGGGLAAYLSELSVRDSSFVLCEGDDGGAIYLRDCLAGVEDCHFEANRAYEYDPVLGEGRGGALAVAPSFPGTVIAERCTFHANEAFGSAAAQSARGGAVFGPVHLLHCSTSKNLALDGGGAVAGGATVDSCILWGDFPDELDQPGSVTWSDIAGGWPGTGNLSQPPLYWLAEFGDLHIDAGSPCVDAGNPASPMDPDGSPADMGAYPLELGYVPEPVPFCEPGVHGGGCASELRWIGSPTLTGPDDFELRATNLLNRSFALLMVDDSPAISMDAGALCLAGGATAALPGINTGGPAGPASCEGGVALPLTQAWMQSQGLLPGDVLFFQLRYRDGSGNFTHTSALRVQFAAP